MSSAEQRESWTKKAQTMRDHGIRVAVIFIISLAGPLTVLSIYAEQPTQTTLLLPGAISLAIVCMLIAAGFFVIWLANRRKKKAICPFCKTQNEEPTQSCTRCRSFINEGELPPCSQCGSEQRSSAEKKCWNCHKPFFFQCKTCGHDVRTGAASCPNCLENYSEELTDEVNAVSEVASVVPTPTVQNSPSPTSISSASNLKGVTLHEKLGEGNFGAVYKGKWYQTVVAAKVLLHQDAAQLEEFSKEISIMQKLQHPHIVRYYGLFENELRQQVLVAEFCDQLDLLSLLRKSPNITPCQLISIAKDACSGMAYLYDMHVFHRDLAARNILVSSMGVSDLSFCVKIADFGLARLKKDHTYAPEGGSAVPVRWSAVEILKYNKWYAESDIWSFGIVLYEIITRGDLPYSEIRDLHAVIEFVLGGGRISKPVPCPETLYALMLECWKERATERISFLKLCAELAELEKDLKQHQQNLALSTLRWTVRQFGLLS